MTGEEAKQVIKVIVAHYPRFAQQRNHFDDPETRIKSWVKRLKNWDYQETMKKLDRHIETSAFEPTIAEISSTPKTKGFLPDWALNPKEDKPKDEPVSEEEQEKFRKKLEKIRSKKPKPLY